MCASLWRAHPAGLFSHGLVLPRACSPTGFTPAKAALCSGSRFLPPYARGGRSVAISNAAVISYGLLAPSRSSFNLQYNMYILYSRDGKWFISISSLIVDTIYMVA